MQRSVFVALLASVAFLGACSVNSKERDQEAADFVRAQRFAELALGCVHREYPNKIAHVLQGDEDALPPRELTPIFYGCFDWHSAVHGHWLLVRLLRTQGDADFADEVRAALNESFQAEKALGELAYLNAKGRETFERPYGLAWLLQLAAELREWDDDEDAARWVGVIEPIELLAAQRFRTWLPKLSHPVRTGEHSQTAFAFGLLWDWAETANDAVILSLLETKAREFYLNDPAWSFAFEPGGQDFLSPGLAEADFMRRVLEPEEFSAWLQRFLPGIPHDGTAAWLPVAVVTDKSDGKLAHLDGLNLARAWMLQGIEQALPEDDPRRAALAAAAEAHSASGLAAVTGEHYEGGHWLGSFAVYLVTKRGIR